MLRGIDVSAWQTPSDWTPAGLDFVVARASIGGATDSQYARHIAKARAADLVPGAYHFNDDRRDVFAQARLFVQASGDVPLRFLDVEGDHAFSAAQARAFIGEVHRLGHTCGLYMSASAYYWGIGQDYDWIAKWSSIQPAGGWEFWQYTSDGRATDGGRLDLDYFDGDRAALLALAKEGGSKSMFYAIEPWAGYFTIPAGKATTFYKPTSSGWAVAKQRPAGDMESRKVRCVAIAREITGQSPSPMLQTDPADGTLPGLWVQTTAVDEVRDDPVGTTDPGTGGGITQEQLTAAVVAATDAEKARIRALLGL